jgi:UDP-N-acetylmuramate--alanine ligase
MQLHVHLIGVGGAGMSALARLYLATGAIVTGSDATGSPVLDDLRALGAVIAVGHDAAHVAPCLASGHRLVVASSAIPAANPELAAACAVGAPWMKHAEALATFVNDRKGIAVAGTHGKTTTTAMVTIALRAGGLDPSFQVGGELVDLDTSAGIGSGDVMVVEADEFDRRFLALAPEIGVVTNVEPEHFECYASDAEMEDAFVAFLNRVKPGGTIVAARGAGPFLPPTEAQAKGERMDRLLQRADPGTRGVEVIRYAMASDAHPGDWSLGDVRPDGEGATFSVTPAGGAPMPCRLAVPGAHNAMNMLGAVVAASRAGVPSAVSITALATFRGVRRRYQVIAEGPVRVVEDYAHHPTEVRATLTAARASNPAGRLWAVFQPHLRVRTERLFDDFVAALASADRVVLADVYSPAGREPDGGVSPYRSASYCRGSQELVAALRAAHPGVHADHARSDEAVVDAVVHHVAPGDLVVVMGAGPIDRVGREIARRL